MTYSEQVLDAIEQNKFSEIDELLEKASKNDEPEMLSSLAEELVALGFSNYATVIYRQLIADFPKEDLFKIYLAEIFLNDDKSDDGLTLLFNIPKDSDAYVNSLLVQADYYQTEGINEVAKAKLQEAFGIAPDEPVIWFALAELDYLMGVYNQALQLYQKLIDNDILEMAGVLIKRRLAYTLANLGEYEEASQILQDIGIAELDIDAQYDAGLIYLQAGDNQKAIESLNSVLEEQPDYVNAYPNLAKAYQLEDQNQDLLRTAQVGLGYNKFDETLYLLGANAAANLDDLETAESLLTTGLAINRDNEGLRLNLSNLYLKQHEDEKNIELFEEMADADIEDQAHWNMAISYNRLENFEAAKKEFLLAYRSFKENPDFLRQLINFFQETSDTDMLKLVLENYLKLVPDDFDMQELLASLN